VSSPADDGTQQWQSVVMDIGQWQAEALLLPFEVLREKAVACFGELTDHLNDFNEATTAEDIETAFVKIVITSVAAGIYCLGVSQPHHTAESN
jgi:hypothetical protein